MGLRGLRGSLVLLAALAVVVFVAPERAPAADSELKPPLVEMAPCKDKKGIVSVELPRNCESVATDPKDGTQLARWGVNFREKVGKLPQMYLYAQHRPQYARARLCGSVRGEMRNGDLVEGSVEVGPGSWKETRGFDDRSVRVRVIEHDGDVYTIWSGCHTKVLERYSAHVEAVFDTFKVIAEKPPRPEPLPEYKVSDVKGTTVWSDASKRDVSRVLKFHTKAWELMAEVLPGEPFLTDPPLVVVCEEDADYRAMYDPTGKDMPTGPMYLDKYTRGLVVKLAGRRESDFDATMYRYTALQYMRRHFGGPTPGWLEDGLRMYVQYGVQQNGHLDKPYSGKAIKNARAAAEESDQGLKELFDLKRGKMFERAEQDHELYAWHYFFRHGPGAEKYADVYKGYFDVLREEGDAFAAAESLSTADFDGIKRDFHAWIRKWRK